MAASTYTRKAIKASTSGKFKSLCTSTVYVTASTLANGVFAGSTVTSTDAQGGKIPMALCSTIVNDVFRIAVSEDSHVMFYVLYDSVHLASSHSYAACAVRIPYHGSTIQDMSPAWGASMSVGTSTQESGWRMFVSTAAMKATSTGECEAFVAGPFESAKYAMNFGATSTSGIDKNQNYFEVQFGLTTASTTYTYLGMTTNAYGGADPKIICVPIEVPY